MHVTDYAATITLTSTVDGRQAACPGDVVTYTCNVIEGNVLQWIVIVYSSHYLHQRTQFWPAVIPPQLCSVLILTIMQATLTDVGTVQGGAFRDMTSIFRFTVSARVNGTVVECRTTL